MLMLVLFIDGQSTYEKYPLPQNVDQWAKFYVEGPDPESVYRSMYGYSKSEDPCCETPPFEHEYKILWINEND